MKLSLGGVRLLVSSLPLLVACQGVVTDDAAREGDAITSNSGKILQFEFDGSVLASANAPTRQAVLSQLAYLQGILTTDVDGNARVGGATLTNVQETRDGDAKTISYHASLAVAWPKRVASPNSYALSLPNDVRDLDGFNAKYDGKCGENEYGRDTFWHDFNPKARNCRLAAGDVVRATAAVSTHPQATTNKYPEYDRVWADDRLDVVGVFGILDSFTPSDGGVIELEAMLGEARRNLTNVEEETINPSSTVLRANRLTGKVTLGGRERTVNITAILVNSVASAGSDFDALYQPATEKADLIYYGGHSGLGTNIASLANRARVTRDKYQIVYLNGCNTFAYLGSAWNERKREANGAQNDPNGTRDLDIFGNALPAYDDNGRSMLAVYRALVAPQPVSYNTILQSFSNRHLSAVFGEEDNQFQP